MKTSMIPKTHLAYWRERIIKPPNSPNFVIEIAYRGERHRLSLETPNKEAAACRARSIYEAVRVNGWEATLQKIRPALAKKKVDLSVGEYIDAVCEVVPISKTLCGYIAALRKIAADVAGIDGGKAKHDYRGGGTDLWRDRVGAVKLSALTAEALQKWKVASLKRAGTDEAAKCSARVSINSYLRCARSLFQPEIVKHLKSVELPDPLPFKDVKPGPQPPSKYFGTFDLGELITKARAELAGEHPEQFKILLLCGMVGLRRGEADLLPWTAFNWHDCTIHIKVTKHFAAKTRDSHAAVRVDRELMELFRGYRALATSEFAIEAPGREPKSVNYAYYRCAEHFEELIRWLRKQGLTSTQPLHEMRKMFGSKINEQHGIHAASVALRHANIGITAAVYVDSRSREVLGLGHLLAGEGDKVTPITATTKMIGAA